MSEITETDLLQQRKDLQKHVDLMKSFQRLSNNRDFNKVILDEFMIQEAARFVQVSTDPNLTAEERADALGLAQAAGYLKRYLDVLQRMGKHAVNTINRIDEELEDMRASGEDE